MHVTLARNDVVGKKITDMRQSPWTSHHGVSVCTVFARVDDGLCLKLNHHKRSDPLVLVSEAEFLALLRLENWNEIARCTNHSIAEIVTSPNLSPGSIGIVLGDDSILCCYDPTPFKVEVILADPSLISHQYCSYWDGKPFTLPNRK